MTEMSWQVNEEVSRDVTGEADGMNQGVDSRDGVMHIWMSDLWFSVRRNVNNNQLSSTVDSTKVLCPLFDETEILMPGDSPSIFPSLDKT